MDTAPVARNTRSQTANTAITITPDQAAQRRYPAKLLQSLVMPVLDENSGQSLQYRHLRKHPKFAPIWNTSYANELGRLCQFIGKGSKGPRQQHTEGTNTFRLIKFAEIPQDRRYEMCHSMVVCEVKPHKEDPKRTGITVTGSQICHPRDVGTPTGSLDLIKLIINSVFSRHNARFVSFDLKNFYLQTPMDQSEYVCIKFSDIPQEFIEEYDLSKAARNGWIYFEILRGCYGLPQSGRLANELLCTRLEKADYYEAATTPGL